MSLKTLKGMLKDLKYRRAIDAESEQTIVELFHRLYYDAAQFGKTWADTRWRGSRILKNPMDLWLYQELVTEVRPDLVIETGTRFGGSAVYMADLCKLAGHGRVLTIDIEHPTEEGGPMPEHPLVEYFLGSSVADATLEHVAAAAAGAKSVLVVLDSDHSRDHVLRELRAYAPFVTPGSFVIVEDSNVNGHPVDESFGPGPYEAIEEFLSETKDFVVDERSEKFYLTFNPRGYLRRV